MKNKFLLIISIITISFFGIKKLMASEESVTEFTKFGNKIGVNPDVFMYTVGFIEVLTAVLILFSLFNSTKKNLFGLLGHTLMIGTMLGAIGTELFIRDEMKFSLVLLAIGLIGISIFYLKDILTKVNIQFLQK